MEIKLKGIPVNKVYYLGQPPKITNGCFQIINHSGKPVSLSVLEVHVSDGEKDVLINEFHLYKLPDYVELDQKSILVGDNEDFKLDLSFPFISENGFNRDKIKVNVTIKANDKILQSSSPIIFDLRVPK